MTAILDKQLVKDALRELINEEPQKFKDMLKDLLNEQSLDSNDEFKQFIQKNFKRFDATFKALA